MERTATTTDTGGGDKGKRLTKYLEQCVTVAANKESHVITPTEKDRKTMIRTVLGNGKWSKVEFKDRLQEFTRKRQWKAADTFLEMHGRFMMDKVIDDDEGRFNDLVSISSPFQDGLRDPDRFREQSVSKLFSFMARGRTYQGRFERILRDMDHPNWLQEYHQIVQDPDELVLLRDYCQDWMERHSSEKVDTALLNQILHMEFPPAPSQPVDGGKASGKQSEINLIDYLQDTVVPAYQAANPEDNPDRLILLAPVFLQVQRKGQTTNSKRCPNIIQLPQYVDLFGQTSEMDAILFERLPFPDGQKAVRVVEVWEAKATLHPVTLSDALCKKAKVLEFFTNHQGESNEQDINASNASLVMSGESYDIHTNGGTNSTPATFGIFGKTLLSPPAGVRRMETTIGEALMQSDPSVVKEFVESGHVTISKERIMAELSHLVSTAAKYDAKMILNTDISGTLE